MTDRYILDTGPLGELSHPRAGLALAAVVLRKLNEDVELIVPEIADYEVRRELIRARRSKGIARLDRIRREYAFLPIDSATMLRAAELWASVRQTGNPTADPKELDGDAILAAQAELAGAVVLTENVGHLSLFVATVGWREFLSEP